MNDTTPNRTRALPYRVLDLADERGMLCGKILADLGGEVIKIEPPQGDPARDRGPFCHDAKNRESSLSWFAYNTGKKSVTLDIASADGKSILTGLAKTVDLIIETFKPGYLEDIGLGYDSLLRVNPGLVMVSITPFGDTGPHKNYKSSDLIALATGGLLFTIGDPGKAPVRPGIDLSYSLIGTQSATAAITALYRRGLSGKGEHVHVSMQECIASTSWIAPNMWILNQRLLMREGSRSQRDTIKVRQIWRCLDGYISWRLFTGADADKTVALIAWMDADGLAGDLKFVDWKSVDMSEVTQEQINEWEKQWTAFFALYSKEKLHMEAIKRGIMLFPVYDFSDLNDDTQLKARDFWKKVEQANGNGELVFAGPPFKTDDDWYLIRRSPLIGEQNREIYTALGFSDEYQDSLRAKHVI